MDGANYKPAAHVLGRLRQVDFVAVVGPKAVGKTTVMKAAMARHPEFSMVVNHTSRQPRPGEREGVDYIFETREQMEARIKRGEFVQVAPAVLGEWYATAPEGYATTGVCLLAVVAGAVPVFRSLPFKSLQTVFILPPDAATWQKRLENHGFTPEQLERRMREARQSLEFALADTETRFVVNDSLQTAAEDFAALALGKPTTARLRQDQSRAAGIVRDLLRACSEMTN